MSSQRKNAYTIIAILSALALVTCSIGGKPEKRPEPTAQERAAIAKISAEPKVKDVFFDKDAAVEWNVGILDDGTLRNGYGMYICELIKEAGAQTAETKVRLVDIAKVVRDKAAPRDAELVTVDCGGYSGVG